MSVFEHLLVDHGHSRARFGKKYRDQCLGRSRGGFSTKIHLACDALGNALRFILSGGKCLDHRKAESLIADFQFNYLIANKGYDSQSFVETVEDTGAKTVIPSRSYNHYQRKYDRHLYRERHLIECFIGKIKYYRRIFTTFEKLSKNYLSFIHLVSSLIWLR